MIGKGADERKGPGEDTHRFVSHYSNVLFTWEINKDQPTI